MSRRSENNVRMMLRQLASLVILVLTAIPSMAQDDSEYRLEVGVGAGVTGYLGDFNGNLTKDLQPAVSLMGRYVFNPYMALRLNVAKGTMKGSSADVETYYPDYAGQVYTFKNSLCDASVLYELNFWPYGTGRDYRGAKRLTPFVFAGLGMTYADVKQTDGAKKGKVAFNLPLGLGVKYKIGERVNLGLEWSIHFAQIDELDGVKDPYYIKSSGLFKNTDCYSLLQATLTYSFSPKCTTCNKEF